MLRARGQADSVLIQQIAADVSAVRAEVASISGRLGVTESRAADADAVRQDHEARLRALERWRYALPVSAVGSIAAVITEIALHFH